MKKLLFTLALLPSFALAHNLNLNQPLPAVSIAEAGELQVTGKEISYQPWQSQVLTGKVFLIQHIAGRTSAKALNAPMIEAIKAAKFDQSRYQTVTIINSDDAIWGTSGLVKSSAEETKLAFPWSALIIDSQGVAQKTWALAKESSAIALLDKSGQVLFVKEGELTPAEIVRVLALIRAQL
ncbi:MAG: YtfJ family protein [Aeromonas sp.]